MNPQLPDFRVCSLTEFRISKTRESYKDIMTQIESLDTPVTYQGEIYKRQLVDAGYQRLLCLRKDLIGNPVWVTCTFLSLDKDYYSVSEE
jgi:hypothetical protein